MKKIALLPFFFLSLMTSIYAQVSINDNGASPNTNAILDIDISTNNKGLLIPRLTTAQRTAMSLVSGDEGLTVYDETTNSYWLWDGAAWSRFTTGNQGWLLEGNNGVNPANDFLGTADANDLVFRTNNTERARFLSNGNFGIGTTNPQQILHIANALPYVRFTDTDGGHHWYFGADGGDTRFLIGEFDPAGAGTYYNYRFSIKEGGYTGIGTYQPEGLLHMKADPGFDAVLLIDADGGLQNEDTWKLISANADNDLNIANHTNTRLTIEADGDIGIGTSSPQKVLHIANSVPYIRLDDTDGGNFFEIGNTTGEFRIYEDATERFEIEAGGNVGIGTDNPDTKLHVILSGTTMPQYAGTVATFQQNNAVGDWARISIVGGNAGASIIDFADADLQNNGTLKYDHTNNFLSYNYYDGSTETEILRIEDYGYVGIRTNNPTEILDVNGAVRIGNTTNTNAGTIRWNGSNFQGYDGSTWKPLDVQTTTGGGWTDGGANVYLTTPADNVGIGNNSPTQKLDVTGSIRMNDGNQAAGKIMVADANGTGSWQDITGGVKTSLIRAINGGNVNTVIYTHPENIEVSFNPNTENVTVENKSTDATHYWDVTIIGGATGRDAIETTNYKADFIRDDGTNDNLTFDLGTNDMGWFDIICTDQDNEQDGFIIHVVYYGDDLNGTVQYWDN